MKNLLNLTGVKTLDRNAQKFIHGGDYIMSSCSDPCNGTVQANIFTGQCTCVTEDDNTDG
ncbi:hypothetical protein M0D21_18340 [Aquimarina sp. D1M17]|uniref:hypothetical protein n=1 Tax=Aquimarina acroporae TaxID=2937283 RepID=UPI0020BF96AB|nr:hypothetical protein [Aquimarina acroporae]MCK8523549.1 hypothetical protein [Aquimarina acroporae]